LRIAARAKIFEVLLDDEHFVLKERRAWINER
jgi:hypothetical protein